MLFQIAQPKTLRAGTPAPTEGFGVTEFSWAEGDPSIFDDDPRSPVVTVESQFPSGGDGLSRLDAQFPKRVKVGEWPLKVTLMDTQFHLRQQAIGSTWLPQVEGFTVMAGVLGFTVGWEQQIVYATAQACVSE